MIPADDDGTSEYDVRLELAESLMVLGHSVPLVHLRWCPRLLAV